MSCARWHFVVLSRRDRTRTAPAAHFEPHTVRGALRIRTETLRKQRMRKRTERCLRASVPTADAIPHTVRLTLPRHERRRLVYASARVAETCTLITAAGADDDAPSVIQPSSLVRCSTVSALPPSCCRCLVRCLGALAWRPRKRGRMQLILRAPACESACAAAAGWRRHNAGCGCCAKLHRART